MIEIKTINGSDRVHCVGTLNTPPRLGPAAIIFLGPPAAGKGTQARHVANERNLPYISTGDVFRTHVGTKTALGMQAAEFMSRGMLVPDEVVCGMLREHIGNLGSASCLILDGFPRSLTQATWLDHLLHTCMGESHDVQLKAPIAINIKVDCDQLLRRFAGRRSCRTCGRTYNVHFHPPRTRGICDYDGAELVIRSDDSESVVYERLTIYGQNALPITEYYRSQGRLVELDGNDNVNAVRTATSVVLESVFAFAET